MDLFLRAQDIQFLTVGLVKDGRIIAEQTVEVPPEQYLYSVDQFLRAHSVSPEHIHRILVVNGPGSFTASRISVTLANTLAFVHHIPMVALENPERLSMQELLSDANRFSEHAFVVPVYDRPPNIT